MAALPKHKRMSFAEIENFNNDTDVRVPSEQELQFTSSQVDMPE